MVELIFKVFLTIMWTISILVSLQSVAKGEYTKTEKPITNAISAIVGLVLIGLLWYIF